ncbi:ABC transporter permease [Phormidium tenue FACHB-886]|nr:ABC transporter permease [Phormidium tenue FACHB-886]
MTIDILVSILSGTVRAATPLILAGLGELVAEKSGVLNLGVEGMMLMGAVTGFIVAITSGNLYLGLLAAVLVGVFMAAIHAFLTVSANANQIATGLALNIFALGMSTFLGDPYVGQPLEGMKAIAIPLFNRIPVLGDALFNQDILVYGTIGLTLLTVWFLTKTRTGLSLRSVGESPQAAHAIGLPVIQIRYLAVLFGGALAGLAGAYLSLVYTSLWAENMVAGRGWIAVALVVFANWKPERLLLGGYLFGGMTLVQLILQGFGIGFSPFFFQSLPHLATILVLVFISQDTFRSFLGTPASLGLPFYLHR